MASTTNSTGGSSSGLDHNNPGRESGSKNSESTAYEYSCSSSSRTPAAESSSSLSVSNTSNDFQNEMSTSGCSSNTNRRQKYKNMKKAKVRDCMNEIKALMSGLGKSKAPGGTLTTLQQVLQSIRKIHQEDEETNVPKETIQIAKTPKDKSPLEAFGITLTCNNLVVVDVSEELTNLLGFPKDSWKGRPITNFIMRKDIPTLNTNLYSLANGDETNGPPPKNFFARFRCFDSLSHGFNMSKIVEYIPLEAKIVFKKAKSSVAPNLVTEDNFGPEKCFFLKLQPCVSAYTQDNANAAKCFDTRHSFDCKFTHFSKSTVHLLGYLPQDLLGSSIFNIHHPDDLEELLSIYKQVIALKGQPFKSRKMRLKTGNDDWITVETEWSCFVNPWSNQVELIMGKHKVVSGPVDPDIFKTKAPKSPTLSPATVTEMEVSVLQRKIIKLLKQPAVAGASSSSLSEDCTGTNLTSDDNHLCESNTSFALPNTISDSKKGESSSDIISPAESLPTDSDTHVSYGQLNYSYNIKRFLQSRPLTLSKLEAYEQSGFDNKGVDEFMISIPSHQTAHTDDSSIKVNMSDQEVCVGSPHCVVDEDSQHSADLLPPVTQVFTPVHLTQATLREHTKLQEQLYVQRVKKDQSIILPRPNQNSIILKVASCRKRAISQVDTDNEMVTRNRSRKLHQSDMDIVLKKALQNSNFLFQDSLPVNPSNPEKSPKRKDTDISNTLIVSNPSVFPQGLPIKPFDSSSLDLFSGYQINQTVNSVNQSQNNSQQQWPCYSTPGCSFSPYVMGGLLHSGGELGPASDQHGKILSVPWPAHLQPFHVKLMEQSSNESAENTISSTEDTSSSIYYLLDSGSHPNSNTQKNLRKKNQRTSTYTRSLLNRGQRPPWVEAVHWTPDLQLRYDMPVPKLQDVLKKDREFLKSVNSSDVVTAQMYELLGEISEGSTDTGEGEADNKETVMEDMLRLGHQLQVHMESRVQEELMAASSQPELLIPEELGNCDNTEDLGNLDSMNVESMNSDSVTGSINNEDSCENNESLNAFSPEASKTDSFSKREMSVSSEGSCDDKITSDITPSDQTSSGDSASSLKESDGSNEKCVRRPKKTKEVRAPFFEKLFKPLNVEFLDNPIVPGREPFWLHNVALTEDLSYRYQMTPPQLSDQLEVDKEFLNSNPQSDLVLGGLNSEQQSRNNDSTSWDDGLEMDNQT